MQNQADQYSYFSYGQANVDRGLVVQDGISGVGLVTKGLVWTAYDIWFDPQAAAAITTTWTDSNAVITTTWTDSRLGTSGEFPS